MRWVMGFSVIAVIVGVLAVATIPAATITPDQAILRFFPTDTQGVAFVDVAALRNSPLAQDALSGKFGATPRELQEFETSTGFSLQRDLDRVTVGRIGSREMLAVAEGQFDRVKIERFLTDQGAQSETYLGRGIFRHDDVGIAFVDGVIVAGSYNAVRQAIDQVSVPGSAAMRTDLLDAIKTLEAGNQVWAVGEFSPDQLPDGLRNGKPGELLSTLRGGTYQMRVDRDIHARGTGTFASADNARSVTDLARGALAVAKLQVSKEPDQTFLQALDGIQITASGSSVIVSIEESGDVLKKLQNYRPSQRGQ